MAAPSAGIMRARTGRIVDGSAVTGRTAGEAPGATASDIPWLKLAVISRRGEGVLTGITTVQRINTSGGQLTGACDKAGTLKSAPYSADYVFLKRAESAEIALIGVKPLPQSLRGAEPSYICCSQSLRKTAT